MRILIKLDPTKIGSNSNLDNSRDLPTLEMPKV